MNRLRAEFEAQLQAEIDGEGNVVLGETRMSPLAILNLDETAYQNEYQRWLNDEWLPRRQARLRDILAADPHNAERLNDLADAHRRQQVVPFVGAGMSRSAGLPGWGEFLQLLLHDSACNPRTFRACLRRGAYETAADLLRDGMPLALFNEQLAHRFRLTPEAIRGPVRLLPALFPGLVLTTNFDRVLEEVYADEGHPPGSVLYGADLSRYRRHRDPDLTTLLKLHGDCEHPTGRVFTTAEYEAAYAPGSAVLVELGLVVASHNLLFLGASLGTDRTVDLLRRAAATDPHQPPHYAFQPLPATARQRRDREHFLIDRGIYPIWFPLPPAPTSADFDDALEALLVELLRRVGGL